MTERARCDRSRSDRRFAEDAALIRVALDADAVEREMRRQAALADARILTSLGTDDDLDALVAWSVGVVDLDD